MPAAQELQAPAGWRSVDFISDLHLQAGEPATFEAWRGYMAAPAADALFILGDLFEVWVGDDETAAPGFAADCAAILRATAARIPVFFLHGNRDFLAGAALMAETGVTLLQDPAVLAFAGRRWLLTHGDALCLEDVDYLRFRAQVRDADWQRNFLALPLDERRRFARNVRGESEERKRSVETYADVDAPTALAWLRSNAAATMIHGHTHRPGEHALDATHRRVVLSDWDAAAQPPRLEALRLDSDGALQRVRLA